MEEEVVVRDSDGVEKRVLTANVHPDILHLIHTTDQYRITIQLY